MYAETDSAKLHDTIKLDQPTLTQFPASPSPRPGEAKPSQAKPLASDKRAPSQLRKLQLNRATADLDKQRFGRRGMAAGSRTRPDQTGTMAGVSVR
ncbi:hypothetical protein ACCO45_011980 [Purpureocillium lilacinum]|uniref:Uncharacterized protein n=1 Tax=Purpureocillium lilacinum TaxID=33203 RepID=A0ACC4DDW8_PURLI